MYVCTVFTKRLIIQLPTTMCGIHIPNDLSNSKDFALYEFITISY